MMLVTSPFTISQNASMDIGNDSVCTCDITMNVRNRYVGVYRKFGLEVGLNNNKAEMEECTLKT